MQCWTLSRNEAICLDPDARLPTQPVSTSSEPTGMFSCFFLQWGMEITWMVVVDTNNLWNTCGEHCKFPIFYHSCYSSCHLLFVFFSQKSSTKRLQYYTILPRHIPKQSQFFNLNFFVCTVYCVGHEYINGHCVIPCSTVPIVFFILWLIYD